MTSFELGPWEPIALADAAAVLASAPFRWWFAGGHALELHVGRSWRAHDDTDVGIARRDAHLVPAVLDGWEIAVAAAGELRPWDGETLDVRRHENNLWCRRQTGGPWELDVTIGEGGAERWAYRRDPAVELPWDDAVLRSRSRAPYLAPDVQLLFKSKGIRPKDDLDARAVAPVLERRRRHRLGGWLADDHPWQGLLRSAQ